MNTVVVNNENIVPGKIVCVGRNYVEHIKELNNEMPTSMVLFMKPNSALSDNLMTQGKELHYEGELSFIISNHRISAVGFGLDLTNRILQSELKKKGLPWERAKAFDGACVFSDFVTISEDDINRLSLKLFINDKLVQIGGVELMIYSPTAVIREIETFSTLEDGDIVMTGTPKGVGTFKKGDKFRGEIYLNDKKIVGKSWVAN